MTKTLTEQWKDGELPNGNYYTICYMGWSFQTYPCILYYSRNMPFSANVKEVLAAVPSYDEFVQQRDFVKDHQKVLIENMNLKRKLEIATKALEKYTETETYDWVDAQVVAQKALKEMEGVK